MILVYITIYPLASSKYLLQLAIENGRRHDISFPSNNSDVPYLCKRLPAVFKSFSHLLGISESLLTFIIVRWVGITTNQELAFPCPYLYAKIVMI